jgi:serine carboxypeptidase-like clade 2
VVFYFKIWLKIDNHLTSYWNSLAVQIAINAVPPSSSSPVPWNECSSVVQYDFHSVATSVVPVLERLMNTKGFNVHVYSGDVDAIVPVSGTLLWIESLNRTVISPWNVWLDQDNQAGGFTTVYDGFTFSTVRDAGHMVPFYQPARAFQLLSSFLSKSNNKK